MSGRGPDPKDLRASLVDSGWSVVPPPAETLDVRPVGSASATDPLLDRPLPSYDDGVELPGVTQIDTELQARLHAMQRASMADSSQPARPDSPNPIRSRPAPPSLPPPPPPSLPPPAPSSTPLPSFASGSVPDPEQLDLEQPLPEPRGPSKVPRSVVAAPSPLTALNQRVGFAGGEVPLWSLLTPMVLLLVLGSAFVAAAAGTVGATPEAAPLASARGLRPTDSAGALASAVEYTKEAPARAQAPALPGTSIDTEALEARRAEELTKEEALAVAAARQKREVARVVLLRQKVARDPGLFKDAGTLSELRRAAEDPLTAPDALAAMAEAPGPLSADLLYELWTGTVARSRATELARSLVFSKEVRAKASPALAVALDLRIAETCEQNRELLPRVLEEGDRRSLGLLAKLSRRFGCGANKRLDCYACLREDSALDDALGAVKKRREPKPFAGK